MDTDELKSSRAKAGCMIFFLAIPASAWFAYVAMRMWAWFAEPLGAPHLSVVRAMGLGMLVTMYTAHIDTDAAEKASEGKTGWHMIGKFIASKVIVPAVVLAFGWAYAQFL